MANKFPTKIHPAPVPFPNGGGIKHAMATRNTVKQKEIDLANAKHELELAKIHEKHNPKPKTGAPSGSKKAN